MFHLVWLWALGSLEFGSPGSSNSLNIATVYEIRPVE